MPQCPLHLRAGDLLDGQFSEYLFIYFPVEIRGLGLACLFLAPGVVRWSFQEPGIRAPAFLSPHLSVPGASTEKAGGSA